MRFFFFLVFGNFCVCMKTAELKNKVLIKHWFTLRNLNCHNSVLSCIAAVLEATTYNLSYSSSPPCLLENILTSPWAKVKHYPPLPHHGISTHTKKKKNEGKAIFCSFFVSHLRISFVLFSCSRPASQTDQIFRSMVKS